MATAFKAGTLMFRPPYFVEIAFCKSRQISNVARRAVCSITSNSCRNLHHFEHALDRFPVMPSTTISKHDSPRQNSTTSTTEAPPKPKKVTTLSIASKKRRGHKITMVTAYDYPSAVHVDRAGIDVVLVGDSCAMVELGFETTQVCWCCKLMCLNATFFAWMQSYLLFIIS
jgi:hypothetical protein